mmetsp:Transcript_12553/g.39850  ORF Transcript_12553/g.39850 Transcript_12553/m.39850 type:complete len:102 (+) Transcript_12553:65-370(+)
MPPGGGQQPAEAVTKVKIHFKAVGNAPIMRKKTFMINGKEKFRALEVFLRNELGVPPQERLFLYCDSAFAPSPDEPLLDLHQCFASRGELIVNYSLTGAYG